MCSNGQCILLRSSSGSGAGTTFLLVGDFDLASDSENIHYSVHWRTQDFSLGREAAGPEATHTRTHTHTHTHIYIYI